MALVLNHLAVLVLSVFLVSSVPRNEYEFSLQRDKLKQEEAKFQRKLTGLSQDEEIVNNYMQHLKWHEFEETKDAFPPTRPIEQMLGHIRNSSVFKVLRRMPKGGNMHSHENHVLSRRTVLDILFNSSDFKYLHVQNENGKNPWSLNFFVNPPQNSGWVKVIDNQAKYTKEILAQKSNFLDNLSDEGKKYPTDSGIRWRDMVPMFGKMSSSLLSNRPVFEAYTRALLKWCLDEGVQLLEARRGMRNRLYVLDPDPKYKSVFGRKVIDKLDGRYEASILKKIVIDFIKENPSFIGMRRIISSSRSSTNENIKKELDFAIRLHKSHSDVIVGYDLVAEEDQGNSHLFFLKDFIQMHGRMPKQSKVPVYLHTGETNFPDDLIKSANKMDPVATLQNTYEAILYGARRVGHGLGYVKHPYLVDVLKRNNIAMEICPVSNQLLGYTPNLMNHPAVHFLKSGVPLVLGSDDPGTFGYNDFAVDWYEAYMGWGLDLADLKHLAQNSILYSTLSPQEAANAVKQKWQPQWDRFITEMKKEACNAKINVDKPVFGRILPHEGPRDEVTLVHIFGRNFDSVICKNHACKFGNRQSKKVKYVSNFHIICEAPPLFGKFSSMTVPVTVSLDGITFLHTNENFTYSSELKKPIIIPTHKPTCASPSCANGINQIPSLFIFSVGVIHCFAIKRSNYCS